MRSDSGNDSASGLKSIHDWHRKIQENHIGLEGSNHLDCYLSIFGFAAYFPIRFCFYADAECTSNGGGVIHQ